MEPIYSDLFVELSRWQFAATALYHFLFVPLTLGITWLLVIMEAIYVKTGKQVYQDMAKFWGKLFGINFALGVTTGLTMEFEFGTNWSYYSHYVGDVFGAPLAIEGLMAFFLESTFVGLFFLGWDKLGKKQHLMVTFCTALGSNLSALWILVANGWMQNPVGSEFSAETMRMEMTSFWEVVFNPVAQAKFFHTVTAGYVTASIFVIGISAFYILKGRDLAFAKRSFIIAASFGLISSVGVIVMGDQSGYQFGTTQPAKLAAMEGEYETQPAPAPLALIGWPNDETRRIDYAINIPGLLGLLSTRSFDGEVKGLDDIITENEERIRSGMVAYGALMQLRSGEKSNDIVSTFDQHKKDLGYGLLLKRFIENPVDATDEMIVETARKSVPHSPYLFWSFRLMLGFGFAMAGLFALALYFHLIAKKDSPRWFLGLLVLAIPMPWITVELGWFLAEYGRQPWAIGDVLPTFLATSSLTIPDLIFSLVGFITFYTLLLVIEMWLMVKFARKGPSALHTGRYHDEQSDKPFTAPAR